MLWEGSGDVPLDDLLAGRRLSQQLRVPVANRIVLSVGQQLPNDAPEVLRHALVNQFLLWPVICTGEKAT